MFLKQRPLDEKNMIIGNLLKSSFDAANAGAKTPGNSCRMPSRMFNNPRAASYYAQILLDKR
jgi:hypothetical protein